jgi:hypothetical protein
MLDENPYQPMIGAKDISTSAGSQRVGWIAVTVVAAVLPLVLTIAQRMIAFPNIFYLLAFSFSAGVAFACLSGRWRYWGALLSCIVFAKFMLLAVFLDFVLFGFEGIQ